jgi:hypothetical protein
MKIQRDESKLQFSNQTTHIIQTDPATVTSENIKQNLKTIHTSIVQKYLADRLPNKILNEKPPTIDKSEESLSRKNRRILAQTRTNKSPLLFSYKHKIDPHTYPSSLCPLCNSHEHDSTHLFNCTQIPTHLTPMALWKNPVEATVLLEAWALRLADL